MPGGLSEPEADGSGERLPEIRPCGRGREHELAELRAQAYRLDENHDTQHPALNHAELDRLQSVLDRIAYDKEYYMPERGCGFHR